LQLVNCAKTLAELPVIADSQNAGARAAAPIITTKLDSLNLMDRLVAGQFQTDPLPTGFVEVPLGYPGMLHLQFELVMLLTEITT